MEGSIPYDAGAVIRDGIKSVASQGACPELTWPYRIKNFRNKPSPKSYTEGLVHRVLRYSAIERDNILQMKQALASRELFVFGFTVYESFESDTTAKTGIVTMPAMDESVLGGHAVAAVGYDDVKQWFICRNSWGSRWGKDGYFFMPYEYMARRLAADFWVINTVQ